MLSARRAIINAKQTGCRDLRQPEGFKCGAVFVGGHRSSFAVLPGDLRPEWQGPVRLLINGLMRVSE